MTIQILLLSLISISLAAMDLNHCPKTSTESASAQCTERNRCEIIIDPKAYQSAYILYLQGLHQYAENMIRHLATATTMTDEEKDLWLKLKQEVVNHKQSKL